MTEKRKKTDWDAVHRDYRTGKFTLRELADKYGVSHQAINKQAKANGWTQDLGEHIKQATNALLVQELVNQEVAKGGQAVANTVLAAAEVHKQVILKHQRRIGELHEMVERGRNKLLEMVEMCADVREAQAFTSAVGNLSTATKTLIDLERKAFGIDDEANQKRDYEDLLREITPPGEAH